MEHIKKELETILQEPISNDDSNVFEPALQSLNHETLLESARRFGTPQYLLDQDALTTRALFFAETMRRYLPRSEFFYAFKCNDLPFLINALKETGFHADVAGMFELQLALRLGFERIVFNGPGKSVEELKLSVKEKDRVIVNIDNFDELLRLRAIAEEEQVTVNVGLRLNSDSLTQGEWSKFGFELDEVRRAVEQIGETPYLEWAGLHFHCSWNKTPQKYLDNIAYIATYLKRHFSENQLKQLRFFDIGGGFYPESQAIINKIQDKGILLDTLGARCGNKKDIYARSGFDPYGFSVIPVEPLETFAHAISTAINEHIRSLNPDIDIYVEPGRFIATFATSMLLGVTAVKKNCVIVDGGIHMLGDYKFSEYSFAPIVNMTRPSTRMRRTLIYGPLCDPNDLWGYSYYGDDIQKGDILAVLYQGAYTFSTAWRFIKANPRYIAVSKNRFVIAKEAETFNDRYGNCNF
ncbi:MAG: diaminopimelate decarboxylase family protein [Candidatus Omnitrophota bacterium]